MKRYASNSAVQTLLAMVVGHLILGVFVASVEAAGGYDFEFGLMKFIGLLREPWYLALVGCVMLGTYVQLSRREHSDRREAAREETIRGAQAVRDADKLRRKEWRRERSIWAADEIHTRLKQIWRESRSTTDTLPAIGTDDGKLVVLVGKVLKVVIDPEEKFWVVFHEMHQPVLLDGCGPEWEGSPELEPGVSKRKYRSEVFAIRDAETFGRRIWTPGWVRTTK